MVKRVDVSGGEGSERDIEGRPWRVGDEMSGHQIGMDKRCRSKLVQSDGLELALDAVDELLVSCM